MHGLGGKWLRVMILYRGVRCGPWHVWGPAAPHVARTRALNLGFALLWERCCLAVRSWMRQLARAQPATRPPIATRRSHPCGGAPAKRQEEREGGATPNRIGYGDPTMAWRQPLILARIGRPPPHGASAREKSPMSGAVSDFLEDGPKGTFEGTLGACFCCLELVCPQLRRPRSRARFPAGVVVLVRGRRARRGGAGALPVLGVCRWRRSPPRPLA